MNGAAMSIDIGQTHILNSLTCDFGADDVLDTLPTQRCRDRMVEMAESALAEVKDIWRPKAVYTWFDVASAEEDTFHLQTADGAGTVPLHLGFSTKFIAPARKALIAVYTAGSELDVATRKASQDKRLMDSYLIDLIALRVLKEVEIYLTKYVEHEASSLGWGVSPYLSPGSVHGWDLTDQKNLCTLLPLDRIDVKMDNNGTLSPFKTVSCLLGIGPDFSAHQVGPTCLICSNREKCDHRQV